MKKILILILLMFGVVSGATNYENRIKAIGYQHHWSGDTANGLVTDKIGSMDGTIGTGVTVDTTGQRQGKFLDMADINSGVNCGVLNIAGWTKFNISFLLRLDDTATARSAFIVAVQNNNSSISDMVAVFYTSQTLGLYIGNTTTYVRFNQYTVLFPISPYGKFSQITIDCNLARAGTNKNKARIWVNGRLLTAAETTEGGTFPSSISANLSNDNCVLGVGYNGTTGYDLGGALTNVAIKNDTLTPMEIKQTGLQAISDYYLSIISQSNGLFDGEDTLANANNNIWTVSRRTYDTLRTLHSTSQTSYPSMGAALGNLLVGKSGYPVVFISTAKIGAAVQRGIQAGDSTTWNTRSSTNFRDSGTLYGRAMNTVFSLSVSGQTNTLPTIKGIISVVGETDTKYGSSTENQMIDTIAHLYDQIQLDLGQTIPVFYSMIGRCSKSYPISRMDMMKRAQVKLFNRSSRILACVPWEFNKSLVDTVHYTWESQRRIAQFYYRSIEKRDSGAAPFEWPKISGSRNSYNITTNGTIITTAGFTGIGVWNITNSTITAPLSSVLNGNTITNTYTNSLVGVETYMYDQNPDVSGIIKVTFGVDTLPAIPLLFTGGGRTVTPTSPRGYGYSKRY